MSGDELIEAFQFRRGKFGQSCRREFMGTELLGKIGRSDSLPARRQHHRAESISPSGEPFHFREFPPSLQFGK